MDNTKQKKAKNSPLFSWLNGSHNNRPGVIILGLLIFSVIVLLPVPQRMINLVSAPKTDSVQDPHLGYESYAELKIGDSIADHYAKTYEIGRETVVDDDDVKIYKMTVDQSTIRIKVMLGILIVGVIFWATEAIPIGITALLIGLVMCLTGIMRPNDIARAYAKDSVFFIFGLLALSKIIVKTGLDRRIGLWLLRPAKSLPGLLFIFLPLMALVCAFISEQVLVAFMMPMIILIYSTSVRQEGLKKDRALAVTLVLSICFAANCAGPGSPAAGFHNALLIGIMEDYGIEPSFYQWIKYGLPFVPVMALVIGAYFFVALRFKVKVKELDIASIVQNGREVIGPMSKKEFRTVAVILGMVLLWIFTSDTIGLSCPIILALVSLYILKILKWKDIAAIHWGVVLLYASACALAKGLSVTGGALYIADQFLALLPDFIDTGEELAISLSLFAGIMTNFMSDGSVVTTLAPIALPVAASTGTHPWMIGFAIAFASSFAHILIISTPNNAIAYALAKDPVTGEQLVTKTDFLKHGFAILILSFVVLWIFMIFIYWHWIGF
ncbi:MAG: SLC13 family permease [Candidatus Electryoneaceae bacterium]|nr:SLC13 family permease [Candidatus Electryoneaceae bacterium]